MELLPQLITDWHTAIETAIAEAWSPEDSEAHLQAMARVADDLLKAILATGDHAESVLREAVSDAAPELLPAYAVDYVWVREAKHLLLLWRNIIFEQHRAAIAALELGKESGALGTLRHRSRAKIAEVSADLDEVYENYTSDPAKGKRDMRKWRLQKNPWPVYRSQLQEIPSQCQSIAAQQVTLHEAVDHVRTIHAEVDKMVKLSRNEILRTIEISEQALAAIQEEVDKGESGRPGSLAARLEHLESTIQLPHHLAAYQAEAESHLTEMPTRLEMIVEIQGGMLEIHECNPQRRAAQWLESNVLPLLYEIWEIAESDSNGVKMAIINVRNRALVLAGENPEQRTHDLRGLGLDDTLRLFTETIHETELQFDNLAKLVQKRMTKTFFISPIFSRQPSFISGPAPSTFDQFNRNRLLRQGQEWLRGQVKRVRNFIRLVEQEEALSISEKCVRYIESRRGAHSDSQYASIFLTRGYIGESFCVGREGEVAHFERLVEQWKTGYRGSLCLTGKRLSGKSLFGELVSHRYFPESTVRIAPGETVRVEGRRVRLSHNLEEALAEVRRITFNHRPLIWIDDLELWQDPEVPLLKNVRTLRRFLDSYSTEMFFLVSMGNWMRAYLERFEDLGRIFQAEINLDRMPAGSIREAIWVRHSATNRRLVDNEGRELNAQQVTRVTNRIHRTSAGVVGEALNLWSASTIPGEGNTVINDFADNYSLPDFISVDSGLLLAFIMLQKRTQDYHLRKYFGPIYSEKYAQIVKRLISVGILERQLDHSLEINKLVVNELGELLEYHEYLRYRRWKS
ncbi:MAG: hypothetical protein AAGN35_08880 [Bacteroidota bacterium]